MAARDAEHTGVAARARVRGIIDPSGTPGPPFAYSDGGGSNDSGVLEQGPAESARARLLVRLEAAIDVVDEGRVTGVATRPSKAPRAQRIFADEVRDAVRAGRHREGRPLGRRADPV